MSKTTGKQHDKPILWGAPGSGYSGRIRSYLIKKGIPYQQIFPGHPRFQQEIIPLIGYFVMPVMELTDGTLIQDSSPSRSGPDFPSRSSMSRTPTRRLRWERSTRATPPPWSRQITSARL